MSRDIVWLSGGGDEGDFTAQQSELPRWKNNFDFDDLNDARPGFKLQAGPD
jgi:hypothetical protein